ncbi:MAG: hypothetical protein WBC70_13080 [Candidatus Aminicenantales bacterium]
MGKAKVEWLAQADIFGEGHEQCQAAGSGNFGALKGTEFEILDVLTYHGDNSWSFTCGVKSLRFIGIASILPGFWRNRGFFYNSIKNYNPVIRISGPISDSATFKK